MINKNKNIDFKMSASSGFRLSYPLIWVVIVLGISGLIIHQDIHDARLKFAQHNSEIQSHISDRLLVAETALEGFSAFVSSMDEFDHDKASEFANNLLERYPYLYMFEVAEHVEGSNRLIYENKLASTIYEGFYIRQFDYENTRQWIAAPLADSYYPIIFQAPLYDDERNILGLDLNSSDFLLQAMEMSHQEKTPVATKPFNLAEHELGYVIHRAINPSGMLSPKPLTANRYALLALKYKKLFFDTGKIPFYFSVNLTDNRFINDKSTELVIDLKPNQSEANPLEKILFPQLTFHKSLQNSVQSQPYILSVSWQLRWFDFNFLLISGVLVTALFLYKVSVNNARTYFKEKLKMMDKEGTLYYMANFDSLTGVANRYHFNEFLEMEILRAKRSKLRFSLLFIDINEFKPINDKYGHTVGDSVLLEVATKLSTHLREDELLARFGGDEFILVSNQSLTKDDGASLAGRLKDEFDSPIEIKRNLIQVSLSIGISTYPDDGENIEALISAADKRMYQDKTAGKQVW